MKAIFFHNNTELLLINEQRRILEKLNKDGICAFPFYPIYCVLPEKFKNLSLKEISRSVKKVEIFEGGFFDYTNLQNLVSSERKLAFTEKNFIYKCVLGFSCSIECEDEIIKSFIQIGTLKSKNPPLLTKNEFYLNAKIIKISEIEKAGFETIVKDSVWKKLHNG